MYFIFVQFIDSKTRMTWQSVKSVINIFGRTSIIVKKVLLFIIHTFHSLELVSAKLSFKIYWLPLTVCIHQVSIWMYCVYIVMYSMEYYQMHMSAYIKFQGIKENCTCTCEQDSLSLFSIQFKRNFDKTLSIWWKCWATEKTTRDTHTYI